MARRVVALLALMFLAACHGGGSGAWTKPGADDAATAEAYRDCRALTDTATRTDSAIDQDIAASRASDLQHSSFAREQARSTGDSNRDRADALIASCMEAKGFTQGQPH